MLEKFFELWKLSRADRCLHFRTFAAWYRLKRHDFENETEYNEHKLHSPESRSARCIKREQSDEMQFLYSVVEFYSLHEKIGRCRKFMKNLIVPSSKTRRSPFFLASLSHAREMKSEAFVHVIFWLTNERAVLKKLLYLLNIHLSCHEKGILMIFMCFFGNKVLKFS